MEDNNDYHFILNTIQASSFKCLIEALKEILTESNIELSNDGFKIKAMNPSRTVLVHLKLLAKNFEYFYCNYTADSPLRIGVSMINFFTLIKMINNNDTLTLFIKKNAENKLGIKIENSQKNKVTHFMLNLIELPNESIEMDSLDYPGVIIMPATEFQSTCKLMSPISQDIDIKIINKKLIFCCNGDFASQITEYTENDNNDDGNFVFEKNIDENEIIQGVYSLKYLLQFTKCTNLSNNIQLFMKNDYLLIIQYKVAGLGTINLCLVPKDMNE